MMERKEWLDAEIEAYLRKRDAMEELEGQLRSVLFCE
jgi:hypothetical protein